MCGSNTRPPPYQDGALTDWANSLFLYYDMLCPIMSNFLWCLWRESNPHPTFRTWPSTMRDYQFPHRGSNHSNTVHSVRHGDIFFEFAMSDYFHIRRIYLFTITAHAVTRNIILMLFRCNCTQRVIHCHINCELMWQIYSRKLIAVIISLQPASRMKSQLVRTAFHGSSQYCQL